MSMQVQHKPSSSGGIPNQAAPISQSEDGQGRSVEVLSRNDFESYKSGLKGELESSFSRKIKEIKKGILYATAGVVCVVAAVAILCYLKIAIPAAFVWPGVSKVLVALGLSGLTLGGLFSIALASDALQKGADPSTLSRLVDSQSRNLAFA